MSRGINSDSTYIAEVFNTNTVSNIDKIIETAIILTANNYNSSNGGYLELDYNLGSLFSYPYFYPYFVSNISIINIPTDITKVYTISLIFNQYSQSNFYQNTRCSDTNGNFILGSSSTFGSPLFNNGTPAANTSINYIIQTISIVSIPDVNNVYSRYLLCSYSNNY